ncbi:RMND5A protein [Neohortaea acidophila]|uniref:GID complex catalytic subunit 2 n=1 Tax=Neohortaea acidophila TaxID=245834 RepID=A0A6A6PVF8_9PEZI|nr:RMND5A protein [Neohortaea acidophila]KAF2483714.1 RMND5A protein [Neohortaea acidophila]
MDGILTAHAALEKSGNLSKAIADVQLLIQHLQKARDAVAETPELTAMHMAKLKQPVKASFDQIEEDLKEVNKGLNHYQKAVKDKFKAAQLPAAGADGGVLGKEAGLVNRAIAMHLLREGKFDVAHTFVREVNERAPAGTGDEGKESKGEERWREDFNLPSDFAMDEGDGARLPGGQLQSKFSEMYHVLNSLNNQHDLGPAIAWARVNSNELERRGSNLEFELAQLKFIELYTSCEDPYHPFAGPLQALQYARDTFPAFSSRYCKQTSNLLGSLAFSTALDQSPYTSFFHDESTYTNVAATFTREFCGMLGLSEASPLYTAVTAGGISLPILEKVERVMAQSRGQWTSVNELPVETPLPPGMQYHSIFVCPVSKEQGTDANPPMMLPCGHVIAKESLEMHARGKSRMKCPYCPNESHPREAKRVYI